MTVNFSRIGRSALLILWAQFLLISTLTLGVQDPSEPAGSEQVEFEPGKELRVFVGKSLLVNSPEELKRVSVTESEIASALVVSPNQLLIHGKAPGRVTLFLWDQAERTRSLDLSVEFDVRSLRGIFDQIFGDNNVQVNQVGTSLVLTGEVTSDEIAEKAIALARIHTQNVVDMLGRKDENQAVLLQVKFAEVDRAAVKELGFNLFSTGATNTLGYFSTLQFQQASAASGATAQTTQLQGAFGGKSGAIGLSDLLNIFVYRPDLDLGVTVRALEQRNLLEMLAEPNVLALNRTEASFLAGGEFPFPVLQGGGAFQGITIVFKEFGIRLKFRPEIQQDGTIRLKVAPEVSALDYANSLTIEGFVVPALTTRRADTEVALRDGQSFAIAGLIDNRLTEIVNKIPLLGDIPFIGKIFRSSAENQNQSELLVLVTPRLVDPVKPGELPPLPEFSPAFRGDAKSQGGSN